MRITWMQKESDEEYVLGVDIKYTIKIHELHNYLPVLA